MSDPAASELVPLPQPPEGRPRATSQPCEACGSLIDPLRALIVLAYEDGFRVLCGSDCERDFRDGARQRRVPTPITLRGVTPPLLSPPKGQPRAALSAMPIPARTARGLGIALGAVVIALLAGLGGNNELAALVSALCSVLAAAAALWASAPMIADAGWLAWGIGPAGAMLAAMAAARAVSNDTGSWLGVEGAALAALAIVARAWLDRRAREPVDAAVHELSSRLPTRVHVPVPSAGDPLAISLQLSPAESVRTGEEIIATRGEILAVDGIVQAGEANVLPYPGATTPLRRRPGQPLLAGARVVDGSVRVLSTRVGDERSLVRLARVGSGRERDSSPFARVVTLVSRWGGLGTVALAIAVGMLSDGSGPSAPLAAASAVLLSAPLWSLRRAAQLPRRAAVAMAGARGIVYQSASALDTAGRATAVALSPHGVLTERRPAVVELHVLEGADADRLIAVAAAAERSAGNHPIAGAIERFARERRLPEIEVRRPVFHAGKGVSAISPQGQPFVIGSRRFLLEEGISVAAADAEAARAEARERTPVFIALDGRVRAVMSLQYELRVGARPAVQKLFDLGLEVMLLTGNQRGAVQALADGLDIHHIKAELLPEERGHQVGSLHESGSTVAALGWPGEDDAVLAAADAAIVLGSAGGPMDRGVALVSDDVRDAAAALWIARAAREAAWSAVGVASVAFALVVAAAAAGLIVPGVAALLTAGVDAYCLPAGARLMRRIALRLPARS
ncbi:MAG TPA: HAD family hydrolase [Polyangiales bacterium]|nr:HAD family hydrolase [Polyangiales bacterium]